MRGEACRRLEVGGARTEKREDGWEAMLWLALEKDVAIFVLGAEEG